MRILDELLDAEGRIDEYRWAEARAATDPVGECHCGAIAYAGAPDGAWGKRFNTVECAAGHEAVIPVTRVVRSPTARVLVPAGVPDELAEAWRERDAAILGERD